MITQAKIKRLLYALSPITFFICLFTIFFAPVIFHHKLLAPGDGLVYYLPNFYAPRRLWDPLVMGGFPIAADIQLAFWYPISILFAELFRSWNGYVITAYVLAAYLSYEYVRTITGSRWAGVVSGTTYSMSGFMIAHLGHVGMLHSAAWIPLQLLALEKLRAQVSARWIITGCLAYALCILAGHPQIFTYALFLNAFYIVFAGWSAPIGPFRYYLISLFTLLSGCGLTAVQLIPTIELTRLSLRANIDYQMFTSYSLPLYQLPTLFFPYLYGGSLAPLYNFPYFGAWPSSSEGWGLTEMVGYVGFLPPMLSGIASITALRERQTRFWLSAGVIALLLALGDATPLIRLAYWIPGLNQFRVPTRYLIITTLSLSVLSGFGLASILRRSASSKQVLRVIAATGIVILLSFTSLSLDHSASGSMAKKRLYASNPAIYIPFAMFIVSALALALFQLKPFAASSRLILLAALVISLASFGSFYEWRYTSPSISDITPPDHARRYKSLLEKNDQRLLTIRGGLGAPAEIPPNLSRLWDIPNMSAYNPLLLSRISTLLSMPPHGTLEEPWWRSEDKSLDILAIRYVITPRQIFISPRLVSQEGIEWTETNLEIPIGKGCDQTAPERLYFDIPRPLEASRIGIVSAMACSTSVIEGEEIARVLIHEANGTVKDFVLRAGRDSSEWAYDCSDVLPQVKHGRARIFRNYEAQRDSGKCMGHDYITIIPIPTFNPIKSVEIVWTGRSGSLVIKKVSLIDKQGLSQPLTPEIDTILDHSRWQPLEKIGEAIIYENKRALPRAWLVYEVIQASDAEAIDIIKTANLPNGKVFDPLTAAIVDKPISSLSSGPNRSASIEALSLSSTAMEIKAYSDSPALLVTSDIYYPGWRVTIDGQKAEILRVDFTLRGVMVPAGKHTIRFEYIPQALYFGLAISIGAVITLIALLVWQIPPNPLLTIYFSASNIERG